MLAYAKCMREHGIDMPDPQPGQRGIRLTAPEGVTPEEMEKAEGACRKHLEDIEAPELTEEQQKEFQEAALAHARCMREHGIDIPDPTFDEDGRAEIRIRREARRTGPDPDEPKWKAAEEACRDKLPFGGEPPSTEEAAVKRAAVAALRRRGGRGRRRAGRRRRRGPAGARRRRRDRHRDGRAARPRRPREPSTARSATRTPRRCWPARPAPSPALPEPGAVIRRGEPLYRLDDAPAAWLLYGSLPAWRDFSSGMTDGEDVRQLERNLRALGHDPDGDMTVDDDWDWATTAAVCASRTSAG